MAATGLPNDDTIYPLTFRGEPIIYSPDSGVHVGSPIWKPTIDTDGNLSWSNDLSLTPPNNINIKGDNGANLYDTWLDNGNSGTFEDFLDILKNGVTDLVSISGDIESYNNVNHNDFKLRKLSGENVNWLTADGHIKVDTEGLYIFEFHSSYNAILSTTNTNNIWLERASDNDWLAYTSPNTNTQISTLNYIGQLDPNDTYFIGSNLEDDLIALGITWKLTAISTGNPFWIGV